MVKCHNNGHSDTTCPWLMPGDIVDPDLSYVLTIDAPAPAHVVMGMLASETAAVVVALARQGWPLSDRFVLLLHDGRLGWAYEQQVRCVRLLEKAQAG